MTQNVKKTPEETPKKYTLNLDFSSIMTAITVLVGCIVISFMMGVIVGRDEEPLPGMQRILPQKQDGTLSDAATKDAQGKGSTKENGASGEKIMTPEELKYASALKGKGGSSADKKGDASKPVVTAPKGDAKKEDATKPKAPTKATDDAQALFDFVFQVSSLKDEKAVDTLREQLEGEGLRTRMSKSGDYLIVFVLLRGTVQQAQEVRARMIALKLGDPLQKQKTPVQ